MTKVYHDNESSLEPIMNKTIAVIGYGNQGRAQALNLRDSGIRVIVGNPKDPYAVKASEDGFCVKSIIEAVGGSEVVMVLIPDEIIPEVFKDEIAPHLMEGACVVFASGYCAGFGLVKFPDNVDVVMIAPRMIGPGVRDRYVQGLGFPSFVGVHQDFTGRAKDTMLALAKALGTLWSGGLEISMRQEAELDLFSEQGFGPAFGNLLMNSIQLLVGEGYPVEAVLMELFMSGELEYTLNKMTHEGVIEQMDFHSHTSQYGSMTRARRFAELPLREKLKQSLDEIRSGKFITEWTREQEQGLPNFKKLKERRLNHPMVNWQNQTRDAFHFHKVEK